MSIIISQSQLLRLEIIHFPVLIECRENVMTRQSKSGRRTLFNGNAPESNVYTTRSEVRCRSLETGRFVSMSEWVKADENEDTVEVGEFYPSMDFYAWNEQVEDNMIAIIDGDTDDDGFMEGTFSELEEWCEFHNSWEEWEDYYEVDKDLPLEAYCHVPTDTVFPEDTINLNTLIMENPMVETIVKMEEKERPKRNVLDIPSTLKSINWYRSRRGLAPINSLQEAC